MWVNEEHILPYVPKSIRVTFCLPNLPPIGSTHMTHRPSFRRRIALLPDPIRVRSARWGLVLGLVVLLSGCQTTEPIGTDAQRPYLWEELPTHPDFVWHRHSVDSATVLLRLPDHEPLHLREGRDEPFRFALTLDLYIEPLEWPGDADDGAEAGTASLVKFNWEDVAQEGRDELIGRFTFALGTGRYRIVHVLKDVHRGSQVVGSTLLDGWSPDAPARLMAFDTRTGQPAWNQQLAAGTAAGLLLPPDLARMDWMRDHLPPVDSFPSAPFLDRKVPEMRFPEPVERQTPIDLERTGVVLPPGNWEGWSVITWDAEPGIHRWVGEGANRPMVIAARRAHFPEMRDLEEMMQATRYIATRDEYQSMRDARDPKQALDGFWLQFASNAEEARTLIRTYYGRVRDANHHFSGLREGWRTDRGMVYVVMGHPDRTRRDRYGETWIYGEEGDINALIFRFSKKAFGDEFNHFTLERYPGFRSPWEAMVSSWRRGKIRKR